MMKFIPIIIQLLVFIFNIESGIPLRNPMSKDRHCRVFFIVPETFKNYCTPSDEYSNSSTNLSNALLTSTLAIQKVKAIVGSSRCIMICDKVDKEEVSISAILFAPILGPTIFDSYNLRKRSEVLKILHESGIPTPNFHLISAYEDETSMVRQINHFMKESPNITQWNLHHNDQSIIDLDLIKSRPPVCVFSSKDVSESDIASILQTSNQFKGHLHSLILKSGAILEENRTDALIEVTMIVDNVGKFNILGSVEQVSIDKSNDPIGRIIPQYSMTHKQLLECCQKCASVCPKYGLIGIITLELIAWKESIIDQDDVVTRYICRNLYTRFTPSILRMLTVNVVSGLMHNHNTGELIFSQSDVNIQIERLKLGEDANRKVHKGYTRKVIGLEKEQKRYAFYSEIPTHAYAGVVSCATVFAINNDVKYDRLHRSGTLAEIFDTLEKQSIPLCCVADSVKEAMEMFVKDLLVISRQLETRSSKPKSNFYVYLF